MSEAIASEVALGAYLKDRRGRIDPRSLGLEPGRRRTPGLRREEVAQRAGLSATWYTWLEQGRGGAPSAAALERIAAALRLSEVEREHLFLLGLGRPPARQAAPPPPTVDASLQRVLDALETSPAVVKTATWDIVGWNRAAAVVLTDYATLEPEQRNVLRLLFQDARVRSVQDDWWAVARFVVGVFRAEVAREGGGAAAQALVEDLSAASPEFVALWAEKDVQTHGVGAKRLNHPRAGPLAFQYTSFAVDGRPGLGMVVYTPATPHDAERVRTLLERAP